MLNSSSLKGILEEVQAGRLDIDKALEKLKFLPYDDVGFAKIDHHRVLRQGFPEVIYCEGKTPGQVVHIMKSLNKAGNNILATRASADMFTEIHKAIPEAVYHEQARLIVIQNSEQTSVGNILIVSAGTADLFVAEEAALTAEVMGNHVQRLYDVGVAGIHRLFQNLALLHSAKVIVVVAGMEGALASVVGGLVDKPVIAVPTSVGYGASFGGVAALLTMLNSCAAGVSVVNIDNGFGAGYIASLINKIGVGESADSVF